MGMLSVLKKEKNLFLFVTLLNTVPVLLFTYFPTLDGPAHLYNSYLIRELLFHPDSLTADFFDFNSRIVPNWLGHMLLVFSHMFLPGFLAEKVLLLVYIIGLPYAFRAFVLSLNARSTAISFAIFPFTYSFLWGLGFYNFSLATVLLFIALRYGIKTLDKLTWQRGLVLFFFITLTYFAHLFIWGILGVILILYLFHETLFIKKKSIWETDFLVKVLFLLAVSLLSIVFFELFISDQQTGYSKRLGVVELVGWIRDIRCNIIYNYEKELPYTMLLFFVLFIFTVIGIHQKVQAKGSWKNGLKDFWMLPCIMLLFTYFLLPNENYGGGFISIRMLLLFYMFLLIWLALQPFSKRLLKAGIILILFANFSLVYRYTLDISRLNDRAKEMSGLSDYIEPHSVVFPVRLSDHWLDLHFSNYLGINKPVIVLENYEADTRYFPVVWNKKNMPCVMLGEQKLDKFCMEGERESKPVDFLLFYGTKISEEQSMLPYQHILEQEYEKTPVYQSNTVLLYRRNTK